VGEKVTIGLASYMSCVTDFSDLYNHGLNGLKKGDEHPTCILLRSMAPDATYLGV